jgi:SAM-dependent methyltransferase
MKIGAIPERPIELILSLLGVVPTPMVDTFQAIVRARAIMVATRLGIFDALEQAPITSTEIAERLGTNRHATEKLLNCLVGAGYLRFTQPRYRLTHTARKWLLKSGAVSLHDNMVHRFLEWEVVEHFEDYVRHGKPLNVHERLAPEQWEIYQRGMRSLAGLSAAEVSRRVPMPSDARSMLDIGGAHGYYSVALCRRYPQLQATILDLPQAIPFARPILEQERMGDRISFRGEDALTADLGTNQWDLVFSSQLVHHFDEATNVKLMDRIGQSLRPGGIVAIVEILRPTAPGSAGQTGAMLDLFFAVTSLSGCWSAVEIADWQRRAKLIPQKPRALRAIPGAGIQAAMKPR